MSQRKIQAITRSEAQAHLSSAELLDQTMVVVKGRSWILLAVIVAILAAATVWGFAGRIPREIDGVGITASGSLPIVIENADVTGAVLSVPIRPGQIIEVGDTIATIEARRRFKPSCRHKRTSTRSWRRTRPPRPRNPILSPNSPPPTN